MKKQTWFIIAGAVLLIGGGYFVYTKLKKTDKNTVTADAGVPDYIKPDEPKPNPGDNVYGDPSIKDVEKGTSAEKDKSLLDQMMA